jgi:putative transposase
VHEELVGAAKLRRTRLLDALSIATSSWYRQPVAAEQRRRPGPAPQPIAETVRQAVVVMALANPWYGYKRIAVMCRRTGQAVQDRQAYVVMREAGLLQKPRPREPELYQAAKLFALLPHKPNDLWQIDVTYLHIAGHGWWYAVTVIDYYSRYLLACHLTNSSSAVEVTQALGKARKEAERLCGPLDKPPFLVTDNGPSFITRRFASFLGGHHRHVRIAYPVAQDRDKSPLDDSGTW